MGRRWVVEVAEVGTGSQISTLYLGREWHIGPVTTPYAKLFKTKKEAQQYLSENPPQITFPVRKIQPKVVRKYW